MSIRDVSTLIRSGHLIPATLLPPPCTETAVAAIRAAGIRAAQVERQGPHGAGVHLVVDADMDALADRLGPSWRVSWFEGRAIVRRKLSLR